MELSNIDWKLVITAVLALLSTGGLIGYSIKSKIDARQKENEWKKQYHFENLKRQRELLLEFLGDPWNDIDSLTERVGTNLELRNKKVLSIQDRISHNKPYFPKTIQSSLSNISLNVSSFVRNLGSIDMSDEAIVSTYIYRYTSKIWETREVIDSYLAEIRKEIEANSKI